MNQTDKRKDWRKELRKSGKKLADNLQDYNGIRQCKICGAEPEKQAEWVIKLVEEHVNQVIEEFGRKVDREVIGEDEEVETDFDSYKELDVYIEEMDGRNNLREQQRQALKLLIKQNKIWE